MPETSRHAAVREPRNLPAEAAAQEGEGKSCRGNLMFSVLLAAYIHVYYCAHVGPVHFLTWLPTSSDVA